MRSDAKVWSGRAKNNPDAVYWYAFTQAFVTNGSAGVKIFHRQMCNLFTHQQFTRYETHMTYKHSLSIMTGLAMAILAGIGIAGSHVVASIETETPTTTQVSNGDSAGGYTVIHKDPNGRWPGGERAPGPRVVEVISGVFIDRDKGFDI